MHSGVAMIVKKVRVLDVMAIVQISAGINLTTAHMEAKVTCVSVSSLWIGLLLTGAGILSMFLVQRILELSVVYSSRFDLIADEIHRDENDRRYVLTMLSCSLTLAVVAVVLMIVRSF